MPEGRDVEVQRPDPGLEIKPGAVPRLPLEGNADPAAVQQQRGHILMGLGREHTTGQRDAAQPLGEDELFPTAPAETLRATVAPAQGANGQSAGAPTAGSGGGMALFDGGTARFTNCTFTKNTADNVDTPDD